VSCRVTRASLFFGIAHGSGINRQGEREEVECERERELEAEDAGTLLDLDMFGRSQRAFGSNTEYAAERTRSPLIPNDDWNAI